jgi:hypothetical protein
LAPEFDLDRKNRRRKLIFRKRIIY